MAISIETLNVNKADLSSDIEDVRSDYRQHFGDFGSPYPWRPAWESSFGFLCSKDRNLFCSTTTGGYARTFSGLTQWKIVANRVYDASTLFNLYLKFYGDSSDTSKIYNILPYFLIIGSDSNYDYYLVTIVEIDEPTGQSTLSERSTTLIVRVSNTSELLEDNNLYTLDYGAQDGSLKVVHYLEENVSTDIWVDSSTAELGYKQPTKKNFTDKILSSSKQPTSIIGSEPSINSFYLYHRGHTVERYSYNVTTNELSLESSIDLSIYGSIVNATYDENLKYLYVLVDTGNNDSHKIVALENEELKPWAVSYPLNIYKQSPSISTARDILGIVSLNGAIAIVTREIDMLADGERYLNLALVTKENMALLDIGHITDVAGGSSVEYIVNDYKHERRYDFYADIGWNPVFAASFENTQKLTQSSFRFYDYFHGWDDPSFFIAGTVALSNELMALTDRIPKTYSYSTIYFDINVGSTYASVSDFPMTINPEAWGTRHDIDIDFNGVMVSNVAKLQESFTLEMDGIMEWMTINLELEMEMSGGVNCIDMHEISTDVSVGMNCISGDIDISFHQGVTTIFNDLFEFAVRTYLPAFEISSQTGARVDDIYLPALGSLAETYTGYMVSTDIEFPALYLEAQTGSNGSTELPSLSSSSHAYVGFLSSGNDITIPALDLASNSTIGITASIDEPLPAILVFSTSLGEDFVSVSSSFPHLLCNSSAKLGAIATIDTEFKPLTGALTASQGKVCRASVELPSLLCSSNILYDGEDSTLVFDRWESNVI